MKMLMGAVLAVSMGIAGRAYAEKPQCEANYQQQGGFLTGRTFSTWGDVAGSTQAAAFKKVYLVAAKSGLRIASADKDIGVISAEQVSNDAKGQMTVPWNITVEQVKGMTRVSVSKTTPPGYATSAEAQMQGMCAVIEAAK